MPRADSLRYGADAQDRQAVTTAANAMDQLLRTNPETRGESRVGAERVLIVPPLIVVFEVQEDDRFVMVLSVRDFAQEPPDHL
jgi:hypothetical protein